MNEWIDVKQQLPPYGKPVIVVYAGVVQDVTYALDIGEWVAATSEGETMPQSFVTHWMPLPAPPAA